MQPISFVVEKPDGAVKMEEEEDPEEEEEDAEEEGEEEEQDDEEEEEGEDLAAGLDELLLPGELQKNSWSLKDISMLSLTQLEGLLAAKECRRRSCVMKLISC